MVYINNSPDTLHRVFYHLYFNAFQPNSMMDVRSRTIADPDSRVRDRIYNLTEAEQGYQRIESLTMNGKPVEYEVVGTILEVTLVEPILPKNAATFDMEFQAQVPSQIRRSGRDNAEGISYSMAQWYPKMAEYDYQGWHANPYIAREFYGIWGDFDVHITIDKDYVIGATGYLQNPEEIGHGYGEREREPADDKLTYHFKAPNVHDFVWAADPDYKHITLERSTGTKLHFFFQPTEQNQENWEQLPLIMDRAFDYINEHYGQYPYESYAFIQGGDGGMEYPMATLITGNRPLTSLVGVSVHELMHSWYQMILGTNESLYAWMDEGFTSWASSEVMNFLRIEGLIPGEPSDNPHARTLAGVALFELTDIAEPLSTHSDHFQTNNAYGTGSYRKGSVFLEQLRYILGEESFARALKRYFDTWKFKHPNANDFIRIMEKESGLELDWYREYMVNMTAPIDYGILSVEEEEDQSTIRLARLGRMPLPVEVEVELTDGSQIRYVIPLRIMRGSRPLEGEHERLAPDWPWVNPVYDLVVPHESATIRSIQIDPDVQTADADRANNIWLAE